MKMFKQLHLTAMLDGAHSLEMDCCVRFMPLLIPTSRELLRSFDSSQRHELLAARRQTV